MWLEDARGRARGGIEGPQAKAMPPFLIAPCAYILHYLMPTRVCCSRVSAPSVVVLAQTVTSVCTHAGELFGDSKLLREAEEQM